MNYYRFLLWYYYFSALSIEITSLILSFVGILMTITGLYYIPFFIDSNIYKIFFCSNIPYFLIIIIFHVIYYFLRRLELMNDQCNLCGYGFSIVEIYVNIFGIITSIINDVMILYNISYYEELSLKKKSGKYQKLKLYQKLCPKIILPLILVLWINLLFLSIANNVLIYLKINGSCYNYQLSMSLEKSYREAVEPSQPKKPKKPHKTNPRKDDKDNNKGNLKNSTNISMLTEDNNKDIKKELKNYEEEKNKN